MAAQGGARGRFLPGLQPSIKKNPHPGLTPLPQWGGSAAPSGLTSSRGKARGPRSQIPGSGPLTKGQWGVSPGSGVWTFPRRLIPFLGVGR